MTKQEKIDREARALLIAQEEYGCDDIEIGHTVHIVWDWAEGRPGGAWVQARAWVSGDDLDDYDNNNNNNNCAESGEDCEEQE